MPALCRGWAVTCHRFLLRGLNCSATPRTEAPNTCWVEHRSHVPVLFTALQGSGRVTTSVCLQGLPGQGPLWACLEGSGIPGNSGSPCSSSKGAQGPRDQGQGGGRPGGHLGHPGCARGSSAAPGSCAVGGKAEDLEGCGGQARNGPGRTHLGGRPGAAEQGTSAGWATSARTGTRGTRICTLGSGAGGSAAVQGGAGATESVLARAEAWSSCG